MVEEELATIVDNEQEAFTAVRDYIQKLMSEGCNNIDIQVTIDEKGQPVFYVTAAKKKR